MADYCDWSLQTDAAGAFLLFCHHPGAPAEANARLIASAPEMLSALKASIKLADRNEWKKGAGGKVPRTPKCQAVYDQCVAAIKKAEGI
jgi:hypothetical protein